MKAFENCNNLILSIHLIGEEADQKTRLFETDILSRGEYPLDLKITLKVNISNIIYLLVVRPISGSID